MVEEVAQETDYVEVELDAERFPADRELFFSRDYARRLIDMIDHVIDTEGPIHRRVLVLRIARHHGFTQAGPEISRRLKDLAQDRRGKTQESVGVFFWRKGTVGKRAAPARYSGRSPEMRNPEYICAEELRNIAGVLGTKDAVEVARALGIDSPSAAMQTRLNSIIRPL